MLGDSNELLYKIINQSLITSVVVILVIFVLFILTNPLVLFQWPINDVSSPNIVPVFSPLYFINAHIV